MNIISFDVLFGIPDHAGCELDRWVFFDIGRRNRGLAPICGRETPTLGLDVLRRAFFNGVTRPGRDVGIGWVFVGELRVADVTSGARFETRRVTRGGEGGFGRASGRIRHRHLLERPRAHPAL